MDFTELFITEEPGQHSRHNDQARSWLSRSAIPAEEIFLVSTTSRTCTDPTQSSIQRVPEDLLMGG